MMALTCHAGLDPASSFLWIPCRASLARNDNLKVDWNKKSKASFYKNPRKRDQKLSRLVDPYLKI
jgi:hypothetical protein